MLEDQLELEDKVKSDLEDNAETLKSTLAAKQAKIEEVEKERGEFQKMFEEQEEEKSSLEKEISRLEDELEE